MEWTRVPCPAGHPWTEHLRDTGSVLGQDPEGRGATRSLPGAVPDPFQVSLTHRASHTLAGHCFGPWHQARPWPAWAVRLAPASPTPRGTASLTSSRITEVGIETGGQGHLEGDSRPVLRRIGKRKPVPPCPRPFSQVQKDEMRRGHSMVGGQNLARVLASSSWRPQAKHMTPGFLSCVTYHPPEGDRQVTQVDKAPYVHTGLALCPPALATTQGPGNRAGRRHPGLPDMTSQPVNRVQFHRRDGGTTLKSY